MCIYMHGSLKKGQLPLNLKLYDVDLPWLKTATHLGNELCENRDFVLNSGKLLKRPGLRPENLDNSNILNYQGQSVNIRTSYSK